MYEYPWLIKNDVRAKYLFEHLRPHLLPGDCVVDAGCGYSPLAYHLLENGYSIMGFDSYGEAIASLCKMFPKGKWKAEGFDKAQCPQEMTVLLLLGPPDEESVIAWLKRAVARRPRLIMLEVHQRRDQPGEKPWQRIFARTSRHVSSKEYVKMDSGFYPWSYESKGERYDSERYFEIWKLKSHF